MLWMYGLFTLKFSFILSTTFCLFFKWDKQMFFLQSTSVYSEVFFLNLKWSYFKEFREF